MAEILKTHLTERLEAPEAAAGLLRLLADAAGQVPTGRRRPNGWAAAIYYLYEGRVQWAGVTMADAGAAFGVSGSTVGQCARAIDDLLVVETLDPRYVDRMHPVVRSLERIDRLHRLGATHRPPPPPPSAAAVKDRARELINEGWESRGQQRVRQAHMALQVWPDAADAYVLLGNEAAERGALADAEQHYADGVAAGTRALGSRFLKAPRQLWAHLEARPYLRAMAGLAGVLRRRGRLAEAAAHYDELLRLNPDDHQGIRYQQAACLLELGEDRRLGDLLRRYDRDVGAELAYTRVLWLYRSPTAPAGQASAALEQARRRNLHVVEYLLGRRELPTVLPKLIPVGSKEEAAAYVRDSGAAWRRTPGALEWLAARRL